MAEPEIRVKLTDEEDPLRMPTVAKGAYRGKVQTLHLANGKYVAGEPCAAGQLFAGGLGQGGAGVVGAGDLSR